MRSYGKPRPVAGQRGNRTGCHVRGHGRTQDCAESTFQGGVARRLPLRLVRLRAEQNAALVRRLAHLHQDRNQACRMDAGEGRDGVPLRLQAYGEQTAL